MRTLLVLVLSASAATAMPKNKAAMRKAAIRKAAMKRLLTADPPTHVEPPPDDESAKRLQAALEKSDREAIARELGVPLRYQGLDTEEAACRSFAASGEVLRQQDLDEFAGCLSSMTKFDEDCMVFFAGAEK